MSKLTNLIIRNKPCLVRNTTEACRIFYKWDGSVLKQYKQGVYCLNPSCNCRDSDEREDCECECCTGQCKHARSYTKYVTAQEIEEINWVLLNDNNWEIVDPDDAENAFRAITDLGLDYSSRPKDNNVDGDAITIWNPKIDHAQNTVSVNVTISKDDHKIVKLVDTFLKDYVKIKDISPGHVHGVKSKGKKAKATPKYCSVCDELLGNCDCDN